MDNLIYYFSGTGNSFYAAKTIAQQLGSARVISMRCHPASVSARQAKVIGIVCPVYHWSIAAPIQHFLQALEINPDAYIFAVTTPVAINGHAFTAIEAILHSKGARLAYGCILYAIANLCIVYPPFPSKRLMIPRMDKKLMQISTELKLRLQKRFKQAGWLTKILYPFVMPKYLPLQPEVDRGFYVSADCRHCGICAKVCPTENIMMTDGHPVFTHHCCSCMACVSWCPTKAIKYALPPEQAAQFKSVFKGMMKLPDKRQRYHHPKVRWQELAADQLDFK